MVGQPHHKESLVINNQGKITELGDTNCSLDKAKFRYVGLIKFSKQKITRQKVANFQNLIPQTPETEGFSTQTSDEYGYAGANFMQANYFQKCEPVNRTFAPRGV